MSQLKLSVEYASIDSVTPNPKNPRVHSQKQIRQIAASIRAFGFVMALLVDECLQIICGHGRWAAGKLLRMTHIPIIRLEHLSESQKRAFMIADNKLTDNSCWNDKLLGEHFKILSESEINFDLELTGFEMAEIDLCIEGLSSVKEDDATDKIPELPSVAVTEPGDIWLLEEHRVSCSNALLPESYENLMKVKLAATVFTDPPYNVVIAGNVSGKGRVKHGDFAMASGELSSQEFTTFLTNFMKLAAKFSRDGSVAYIFMDWRHLGEIIVAGNAAYSKWLNMCVWAKSNAGQGSFYRSQHELVLVFQKGSGSHRNNIQLGQFGRYRTNVWNYPGVNTFRRSTDEGDLLALHPTVKPVALVADAILDSSARGDLILDPFLGSGTTLIAAERTGRRCYGMELDPLYVDTIIRRWQTFTNLSAVHESSGQTFAQREQEVTGALR